MEDKEAVQSHLDGDILNLIINRPAQRNALNSAAVAQLTQAIVLAAGSDSIRAIVITGTEGAFCAGIDITWMEELSRDKPAADARKLANLLLQIRNCSKPVIARINGIAMGAGSALAAACDISVADDEAMFALPAVRLGAVPAVIIPFVVEAMGLHQARRFTLTGETFSAAEAKRLGLIHAVCVGAHLDETVQRFVRDLRAGGPQALQQTKDTLNSLGAEPLAPTVLDQAAKLSERVRRGRESREGLAAFVEKRSPSWLTTDEEG